MGDIGLMPMAGIDNVSEDAAMQIGGDNPRLFVRDAINVDFSSAGKLSIRSSPEKVSDTNFSNLWHSRLHGDTFATIGDQWVKVSHLNGWTYEVLATIGGDYASHAVLNSLVCVAGPAGIFSYDGNAAQRLTIETPPSPLLSDGHGSLAAGKYGFAIAWMRGQLESGTSSMAQIDLTDGSCVEVIFPLCLDPSITGVRLYITKPNGGELLRGETYPVSTTAVSLPLLSELGAPAPFRFCSPMPSGKYLAQWRGRLLTAKGKVLRFSQALAYHIHDERHDFFMLPQRITFVAPVEGGIWVGQVDHVVFLEGLSPSDLTLRKRASRAPVPGSAIIIDSDDGSDFQQGGNAVVVWLADNGYAAGTADGSLVERSAGRLKGISGESGTSVVVGERLLTVIA